MGLTKHMAHQFHVEHAHHKTFVAPPLLHPSINHVKSLTITLVWAKLQKSCGVWVCYRSTTCTVYPMVATISPRQNIWGNTQTNFACAKKLSLWATTINSSPQNFIWHLWLKTDTSRSLVLLQEYWQVKCYLQHHILKQHKSGLCLALEVEIITSAHSVQLYCWP